MKKVLRLSESELIKLVKKIINERKSFVNQNMVDAILDKIGSDGYESLSDLERQILDNPDMDISYNSDSVENDDVTEVKCLQRYVDYMLEPSTKGGGLGEWNNDELPKDVNDDESFGRFINYLRELVENGLFSDGDCDGIEMDNFQDWIYTIYFEEILKRGGNDESEDEMYI